MHWLPEWPGLNAILVELFEQRTAVNAVLLFVDTNRVEPGSAKGPRRFFHKSNTAHALQLATVSRGDLAFAINETVDLFHLCATERRLDVSQTIVEPDFVVNIFERIVFRLGGQITSALGRGVITRHDHAAAAGGDDLVAVEAEAGDGALAAQHAGLVPRAQRFSRILNDRELVFV